MNAKCEVIEQEFMKNNEMVDLSDSFLGDEMISFIVSEFQRYRMKTGLILRGNHISGEGVVSLTPLIQSNTQLRTLNLEWNNIGLLDHGIHELSKALLVNLSLVELDLRNNNISANGATALAKAFGRNTILTTIDLRWNNIGSLGAQAILDALESNRTIRILQLSGNNIPMQLMQSIDQAVQRNNQEANIDPTKEDHLLLDCLSENEEKGQLLHSSNQMIEDMRHQLQSQELSVSELTIRLEKQSTISTRLQSDLISTKDMLAKRTKEQEETDAKLTQDYQTVCESKYLVEKEANQMKGTIQRLTEEKDLLTRNLQKVELAHTSLEQELERCRDQLHEERKRANTDRMATQTVLNEKYRLLDEKFQLFRKQADEQVATLTETAQQAEQARQEAVKVAEDKTAQVLEEQMKFEKQIAHVEGRLQSELESRIAASLTGLENKMHAVQKARDLIQTQMHAQTQHLTNMQEEHMAQLKEYENGIRQAKESTFDMQQHNTELEKLNVDLKGRVRQLEHQEALKEKRVQEMEQKYTNLQTLQEQHLKHITESLRMDRLEWEKAMENKRTVVIQLEETIQQQHLVIHQLTQSQEQRLNELADHITKSVEEHFEKEKTQIQRMSTKTTGS